MFTFIAGFLCIISIMLIFCRLELVFCKIGNFIFSFPFKVLPSLKPLISLVFCSAYTRLGLKMIGAVYLLISLILGYVAFRTEWQ